MPAEEPASSRNEVPPYGRRLVFTGPWYWLTTCQHRLSPRWR